MEKLNLLDCFVFSGSTNKHYSNSYYNVSGYHKEIQLQSFGVAKTLLLADLSKLNQNTIINNATLNLFLSSASFPRKKVITLIVNINTEGFNPYSVTFSTSPNFIFDGIKKIVTPYSVDKLLKIDITPIVLKWLSGKYRNYGLTLTVLERENSSLSFLSSKSSLPPTIELS